MVVEEYIDTVGWILGDIYLLGLFRRYSSK